MQRQGRLNIFQRMMLQWNGMRPYNAVHIVRITVSLEKGRLASVIDSTLESLGLTGLMLDTGQGTFRYSGGRALTGLTLLKEGDDPFAVLIKEIETQLNTAFPLENPINPFRFFVLPHKDSFYLGIVYFHWIAGAESIVLLLKGIVNAYMGADTAVLHQPLDLYPGGYGLFRGILKSVLGRPSGIGSMINKIRNSYRPRYRGRRDLGDGFMLHRLDASQVSSMLRAAKIWGVTVNDLFLALLLKSLATLTPRRVSAARRKNITVGSIVNIRRDLGIDSRKTFGLFLGSFVVSHPVEETASLEELARAVHKQTSGIKKDKLYLASPLQLGVALFLVKRLSPKQQEKFYAKYYPLWGGITNMNLNILWEQDKERTIDYLRAVSTGPVTPLVLSITTVSGHMNIGLTFNRALYGGSDIERFLVGFRTALGQVAAE